MREVYLDTIFQKDKTNRKHTLPSEGGSFGYNIQFKYYTKKKIKIREINSIFVFQNTTKVSKLFRINIWSSIFPIAYSINLQ